MIYLLYLLESLHLGDRFMLALPQIREHNSDAEVKVILMNSDEMAIKVQINYHNGTNDTVDVFANSKHFYWLEAAWS